MSRTYRRIKVKPIVSRDQYGPNTGWWIELDTSTYWCGRNRLSYTFDEGSPYGFDSPQLKRVLNRYYSDSGTRGGRDKRPIKYKLNNRYRERSRMEFIEYLNRYMAGEDVIYYPKHHIKFDLGYWFDD